MGESGAAQRLVDVVGNAGAYAGDQGRRDPALGAADRSADAVREIAAQVLDHGEEARAGGHRPGVSNPLRLLEVKAVGADAVEIALEGKVVAARPRRS